MAALCVFLIFACIYDYKKGKIPNCLQLGILFTGMAWKVISEGPAGIWQFLFKTIFLILILYPLYKIGTIGAGDIKLFGCCAGYLPADKILTFLFVSMLIAAIFSLIKLFRQHNVKERLYYLCDYFLEVAHNRKWHLYMENERESRMYGICLSGPVLLSILLRLLDIY